MPRQVDHESRRRHVAAIAAELLVDGGMDALTVRNVADAAGCSTTIVSHYFTDKRDLVLATFLAAAGRAADRFEAAQEGARNPLRASLESLLPLDEDRRRDHRLWFAFWAAAVGDPQLAHVQRDRTRSALLRVERLLVAERNRGTLAEGVLPREAAASLLALVQGIVVQAIFDPEAWPNRRQRAHLARSLEAVFASTQRAKAR